MEDGGEFISLGAPASSIFQKKKCIKESRTGREKGMVFFCLLEGVAGVRGGWTRHAATSGRTRRQKIHGQQENPGRCLR